MLKHHEDTHKKAIKKNGFTKQLINTVEELSELSTKILQWLRSDREVSNQEIKTEVADVLNKLDELQIIIGYSDQELFDEREKKIQKKERIIK